MKRKVAPRRREAPPAGSREFRFYVSKAPEIDLRFAGKHVAIIGDRIVSSGKSPLEVWKRAKKSHPNRRPLLAKVPRADTLLLTPSFGLYASRSEIL